MTPHEKIDKLFQECSEKDWDSYGGTPLHPYSAKLAHAICDAVTAFAPEFASLNIVPIPDGGYQWEWDTDEGTYILELSFLDNNDRISKSSKPVDR